MRQAAFGIFALLALAAPSAAEVTDIALEHLKDNAVADAEEIISMRSHLAKTFIKPGAEITEDTFKKVCGAVGKRVKEITEKEGVVIRHAAVKYRNPKNAATEDERALIERFSKKGGPKEVWDRVELGGKRYLRYSKPIYVEEACLACHGEKDRRPAFIVEKYPEDKAYGFNPGDVRGIISVMIPVK